MSEPSILRLPAEERTAHELAAIAAADRDEKPVGWRLSPRAVRLYLMGGTAGDTAISQKFFGPVRLVELCIATLLTDRALLLSGPPGTGKTWLSEHLVAGVCGDSTRLIQGTAGTAEEHIRYGWNYALLIAEGPSDKALLPSPLYAAMESGCVARFEELSRCTPEIQDALISILSEKTLSVPELGRELRARRGFSLIATANSRDQGTHGMSAALSRRFCRLELSPPAHMDEELALVTRRAAETARDNGRKAAPKPETLHRVVTILRELREGAVMGGRSPSAPCSPSDAIAVLDGAAALADCFGDSAVTDEHCARSLSAAVILNPVQDGDIVAEYRQSVLRPRGREWAAYWDAP